ncbi:MAG: hypothetical protein Q7R57_02460 [Dehalococcoidales bacterium]|nr:hypothetical protein [Dehalococcoidales bacterium]
MTPILAPTLTPANETAPVFTPSPVLEPAPTPKPSPAARPAPIATPAKVSPPQTIAPFLPWGFISKITALVITVSIVAFVVVRKRLTHPKGNLKPAAPLPGRPLHQEADRLRKEVSLKCQEAIAGKGATPGLSQDYLLRKWYFLVETAYLLDIHSRWMQSKAGQIDNAEIRHYRELIDSLRKMMPPEPQI